MKNVILAIVLAFNLFACGKGGDSMTKNPTPSPTATASPVPEDVVFVNAAGARLIVSNLEVGVETSSTALIPMCDTETFNGTVRDYTNNGTVTPLPDLAAGLQQGVVIAMGDDVSGVIQFGHLKNAAGQAADPCRQLSSERYAYEFVSEDLLILTVIAPGKAWDGIEVEYTRE
jgi:hypothetical protein